MALSVGRTWMIGVSILCHHNTHAMGIHIKKPCASVPVKHFITMVELNDILELYKLYNLISISLNSAR